MELEQVYLAEYLATRKRVAANRASRIERYRQAVGEGKPIPYAPRPVDGRVDNTPLSLRVIELAPADEGDEDPPLGYGGA